MTTPYILIIIMISALGENSVAVTTQEFTSLQRCEFAADLIHEKMKYSVYSAKTICVVK